MHCELATSGLAQFCQRYPMAIKPGASHSARHFIAEIRRLNRASFALSLPNDQNGNHGDPPVTRAVTHQFHREISVLQQFTLRGPVTRFHEGVEGAHRGAMGPWLNL